MLPPKPGDIPRLAEQAKRLQAAGDLSGARSAYQRIVTAQPKAAAAWFQLGRVEAGLGDIAGAEAALRKALALAPSERAVWQALHKVLTGGAARKLEKVARRAKVPLGSEEEIRPIRALLSKGEYAAAEAQALALVKVAPEAFWPALVLGQARAAEGRWAMAVGPLRVARERAPQGGAATDQARLAYGRCLAQLGQPLKAEAELAPLVEGHAEARLALARVWFDTLQFDRARAMLAEGQEGKRSKAAWTLLAECEASCANVAAAQAAVARARMPGAQAVAVLRRLAVLARGAGAVDGARAMLEQARDMAPHNAGVLTDLGQDLQSEGDTAGAEALLRMALAQDANHGEAYRALAAGRKAAPGDPLITEVAAQLSDSGLPRATRRTLKYAAAKLAADSGAYDSVFDHLNRANRLMREEFPYDFEADVAEARRLVTDWRALEPMTAAGPRDPVFFVTGLPRSGTTLVETILAAHPMVAPGGEMPYFNRALGPAMERLRDGVADADLFAQTGARYLAAARRRAGAGLFTDKAISTYTRVGHVLRALPGARIVILKRDPRDVGLSMYRNMFPEGSHRYTNDLAAMGRYIRLHEALVAFWAEALPEQVHVVEYEALTADPEPHIRALVDFAGLRWNDACLSPERSGRRVDTLSFAQVRAPIGRGAVNGWRRHEADLAPLTDALAEGPIDLRQA